MFFSSEQFPVREDLDGPREYATLPNRVSVIPSKRAEYDVYIEVPCALFSLMEQAGILRAIQSFSGDKDQVFLYLESHNGIWVFGVSVGDVYYDLWPYKVKPSWATARK